jgi:hypothetical protein
LVFVDVSLSQGVNAEWESHKPPNQKDHGIRIKEQAGWYKRGRSKLEMKEKEAN